MSKYKVSSKNMKTESKRMPWVFWHSQIYRINKKRLFYILFKLELLLEFLDLICDKSSLKITRWLKKERLLEEEILDVLKIKSFNYRFVKKITKISSSFFKIK